MKICFCLLLFVSFNITVNAQDVRHIVIDKQENGKKLETLLTEIEAQYSVKFLSAYEEVKAITISGVRDQLYFDDFMEIILKPYYLTMVKGDSKNYFIIKEKLRWQFGRSGGNYITLRRRDSPNQIIEGFLHQDNSEEPIIGAQVLIRDTPYGTTTNKTGYFQLEVPNGIYTVEIQFVGYQSHSFLVGFSRYGTEQGIERSLMLSPLELQSVTITVEGSDKNIKALVPGVEKLGIDEIRKLPTFLGEIDPVKNLTTLPGVSTAGELSSGYNVRGGDTGQNLLIQDGAVIFNPAHLFGFFSAFNSDFTQDITLYKGGGPAKFGGRISSVLDIKLRNGNAIDHSVSGSVGLVSSRLSVEGPVIKNKTTFLLGGRVSYVNWLLKATDNIQLQNSAAAFHDVTAKVFHRFNENNFVSVTGYRSYDDFQLASDSVFSWQTTNVSLKWDHNFSDHFTSALSLSSSNYLSEVKNKREIDAFTYKNSINMLWLKYDFLMKNRQALNHNFGIDIIKTMLDPGELVPEEENNAVPLDIQNQSAIEAAIYYQKEFNLSNELSVSAGLRYSHFFRLGEDVIYTFDYNKLEGRYPSINDTTSYSSGEVIDDFGGIEPRLSILYLINNTSSIKASYFRAYQYLHFISNTTSVTPQDYWVTSGPYLKAEIGDQFSLGYFQNFNNDAYELSVEGYYKKISNAVDYIDGADIVLNPALEAGLLTGDGLSYGVELLARKNVGKLSGWISYTYSRSLRKFKSESSSKSVNEGNYYPSPYDQPHNLSVIANYKLGKRSTLSCNFSYSTGRPITIPISKFNYDAYLAVLNYSDRNEYRIPDYHRLDVSLTIESIRKKNSRFEGEWVFSVFNLYSRNNAYAIFFNRYGTAKKMSILGSIFPSVTYNFKF